MAKKLAIVRPLPIAAINSTAVTDETRLLTPDPKEAIIIASGAGTIDIDVDLGSSQSVDSFFLGYVGPADSVLTISYGTAAYTTNTLSATVIQGTELFDPDLHFVRVLDAPVTARFIRFSVAYTAGFKAGVVAVGKSFQAAWGHEYGSGRPVEDTGTVERLLSGGFGINEGVRAGGYQWTFGDLDDAEVQKLYAIARDRGGSRPVLVIEDPDATFGLNERTHWALFGKLEPYERQVPGASRYAFTVRDWA